MSYNDVWIAFAGALASPRAPISRGFDMKRFILRWIFFHFFCPVEEKTRRFLAKIRGA
jgi:hypothetical protein